MYPLAQPETLDTPALLVYPDLIAANIDAAVRLAGGADRLQPHVKTHKLPQVVALHLARGIRRFKCATIAEAEMLAKAGAAEVLLAHQPVGPRIGRLLALAAAFPATRFAPIIDDARILVQLATAAQAAGRCLPVYLDLDVGMGRTGIAPGPAALALYQHLTQQPSLQAAGLHAYDGHLHQANLAARQAAGDAVFGQLTAFCNQLRAAALPVPAVVLGGSPSFSVHRHRPDVRLSPGTFALWDAGYAQRCPELPFQPAAVLATRVISRPTPDRLCLDLGHKAVAAENPLPQRLRFLDLPITAWLGHSEEHLVVQVAPDCPRQPGDLVLALPWHICPTTALHAVVIPVVDGQPQAPWAVDARARRLHF